MANPDDYLVHPELPPDGEFLHWKDRDDDPAAVDRRVADLKAQWAAEDRENAHRAAGCAAVALAIVCGACVAVAALLRALWGTF